VTTVLHDIGLTKAFDGPLRFEIEGANAARQFALRGLDDRRSQLVWDGVALHTLHRSLQGDRSLSVHGGHRARLGRLGDDALTKAQIAQIVEAFPAAMKQQFTRAVRNRRGAPRHDHDNLRAISVSAVPRYERPSTVDFLLDSPFEE
jgi:hypothetical protein